MGVVDDDAEGLALVDALHAARAREATRAEGGRRGIEVEPEGRRHAHRREGVVDVEATRQPEPRTRPAQSPDRTRA